MSDVTSYALIVAFVVLPLGWLLFRTVSALTIAWQVLVTVVALPLG